MYRISLLFLALIATSAFAAEVIEITEDNWRAITPKGKEADWIIGDYVIRNDRIVAVIAKPVQTRNANMTVRNVAGAVIDLTFRHRSNDQLSCFYPGAAEQPIRFLDWEVSGGEAIVRVSTDFRKDQPEVETEYRLKDGDKFMTVTSEYKNPHRANMGFKIRDAVRADRGFDHDLSKNLFVSHDYWWRQAYGIHVMDHELKPVADSVDKGRPVIAYHVDGLETVYVGPGSSVEVKRLLIPGEHALDIEAVVHQQSGKTISPLSIVATDSQGFVPHAEVTIISGDDEVGRALTPESGPLTLHLPPGDYSINASALGRGSLNKSVSLGDDRETVKLEFSDPGYVAGNITDASGQAIPAKIQFMGSDVGDPNFGPDTKSFGVKNAQYTANGRFRTAITPGEYNVIVSRGNEYDADFQTITVEQGKVTELTSKLTRSVSTPGWVSADFHSHSSPSGDNTSDQRGRVLNLLAEHIEFAPCTEHNRISSYSPHLRFLDAEELMATCTGMELTGNPLPVNHQNTFPLHHHPHTQDGGGPTTLTNPVAQIERLAMWDDGSDKLVQENHPNLEQIWADQDLDGSKDEGFEKMFSFMDVIEVHPPADLFTQPGTTTGQYDNVIQSWLRMLNNGYRIPGVVNADAHYNFHGSGWLRNYIKSSSDKPSEIDTMEMVHESEHGHLVMTNGPYLTVEAKAGDASAIAGDDLVASDGKVTLEVEVQCPNWFDINRVTVFINGRPSKDHNFTRRTTPGKFGSGTSKFKQTIEVSLDGDAHLIVGTIGEDLKLGPVMGPQHGDDVPVAFCNPIFVDVDGGGFKPNEDMLGLPFPYKAE